MARSKPFPRLSPEYKEKSGWSTHNPTRKYLLLCISIYMVLRSAKPPTPIFVNNFFNHYIARSKPFPRLSPEYKEKSGWSTHNPTRKYLLLCISIYGPSIRKTPHTHIRHPVLHSAARHHRLPSSLSERHPRHPHTLPPPVTDPPPPAPLRTFARQETLAIAHDLIYIDI